MPQAEGTGPAAAPEFVTVVVDATGQAYLDDQPCRKPHWRAPATHWRSPADTEVQLRADTAVPYGRVGNWACPWKRELQPSVLWLTCQDQRNGSVCLNYY